MAVWDSTRICNLALQRLGESPIADLSEQSEHGTACSIAYEYCRDCTLEDYAWPFASKTATLALVDMPPSNRWRLAYRFPSDCLRMIGFDMVSSNPEDQPEWDIGGDDNGKLVLTNECSAVMTYTRRVVSEALYSNAFASALAWRIAMEVAGKLSRLASAQQLAAAAYVNEIGYAKASATAERRPPRPPDARSIRERL